MCLSPPQRPLFVVGRGLCVVGRLGRKKKRARGARFPLPIVPRALSIFSIIDILMGIPSESLCGGERSCVIIFFEMSFGSYSLPFYWLIMYFRRNSTLFICKVVVIGILMY